MPDTSDKKFARLREKAEALISDIPGEAEGISPEDGKKLVHEVLVRQAELEIQNEELRQAYQELEASRNRYSDLYNAAPVGYLVVDGRGMILDANQTLADMIGVDASGLYRKYLPDLAIPDDRPGFLIRLQAFLKRPEGKNMEVRLDRRRGAPLHVKLDGRRISARPTIQPRSGAARLLINVTDISAQKEAQTDLNMTVEKLRRLKTELSALLSCSRTVLEFEKFEDAARKIFDAAKTLIGATSGYMALLDEAAGTNDVLFLDAGGLPCNVAPDLPMPVRGLRGEAYASGRVVYRNDFGTSAWARFLPAGRVALENVLFAPLNADGKTRGVMGLANKPGGFTEEDARLAGAFGEFCAICLKNSRMLEALEASEERFRTLVETASDAIVSIDAKGLIISWNAAAEAMFGYDGRAALGKPLSMIIPERFREDHEAGLGRAARGRSALSGGRTMEGTAVARDGREIPVELSVSPGRIKNDVFFTGIIRDVTSRKAHEKERTRLEEKLRQAHKMEAVGILAGGVAHDFNNILGIVIGNAELAMDDVPEWNPARENLEEIKIAGLRARDVVRQLLSFSRKTAIAPKKLNMGAHIGESMKLLRASIPSSIAIRERILDHDAAVTADPTQIHQILMNLCGNATQAMEETGGTLEITIGRTQIDPFHAEVFDLPASGPYVQLCVSDTGTGIDPGVVEKIYDPYFTTKEVGKGSGMGLAVVHGLVKNHNGGVNVESEPGGGSVFSVFLPAADGSPESAEADVPGAPRGVERILFVDDEAAMMKIGKQTLEKLGYQVESFTDPADALTHFRARIDDFDAVITDMTMPRMSGKVLSREILKLRPDIPVILCSGYSRRITPEEAADIGVRRYLTKPADKRALALCVRQVLDERRKD